MPLFSDPMLIVGFNFVENKVELFITVFFLWYQKEKSDTDLYSATILPLSNFEAYWAKNLLD